MLSSTTIDSGDYWIYTCTCGVPECGGVSYPIWVTHTDEYVVWEMVEPYGGVFKFDKKQYVDEIKKAMKQSNFVDLRSIYLSAGDDNEDENNPLL